MCVSEWFCAPLVPPARGAGWLCGMGGDDREEEAGGGVAAGVEGDLPGEGGCGPVEGVAVQVCAGSAAGEVLGVGGGVGGAAREVASGDGQGEGGAGGQDDAGGPELDVKTVDPARLGGLDPVVGVVG